MSDLKISIITPSFNQGVFIEKNIISVLNQNYPNFEHIIIDGGSTDTTIEVLKKYPHLKWVSEKDKGQADAVNKGLKMATGDIIGWINSDDYYENNIFEEISAAFNDPKVKWIIGNLYEDYLGNKKKTEIQSPDITYDRLIKNPDILKQPCTFFRRDFILSNGGLNDGFYMVMDFDLWVRLSKKCSPRMSKTFYANFVIHPNQKTSPQNILRQTKELMLILKREKAPVSFRLSLLLRKYKSFLKKKIKSFLLYKHK